MNERICYAPLNRLVSVYWTALRETIFNLILFSYSSALSNFIVFFLFTLLCFFARFEQSGEKTNNKKIVILAGMFNVPFYSNLLKCDPQQQQRQQIEYTFIGPYGVIRQ